MESYNVFGLFSRKFPLNSATVPTDVQAVFKQYEENGYIKAEKLQKFLIEVQGEAQATLIDAEHFIDLHVRENRAQPEINLRCLSLEGFLECLLNPHNASYNRLVHHDMTQPLSHYYIYTGHNSYLTGNQLNSDCSEKPIINALLRGVRVIELDLWPDSTKENIHVLHGRTLTSPVDFTKCIEAIKDHAFVASEFPVIVTLEDHLTASLQALAAKILTKTLGDILYVPKEDGFPEFPSPQSLMRRIAISTKPPKEYLAGKCKNIPGSNKVKDPTHEEPWGDELPSPSKHQIESETKGTSSTVPPEPAYEDSDSESETETPKHEHNASEYGKIILIRSGKPKGGSLKDSLAVGGDEVKRVSLSEPQLKKLAKDHPFEIIRFTRRNILRIYPYGLRFNSSNYNPVISWLHGAQMVALNMQGCGRPLWLVQGFFRANGGCGYVKKPDYLLETDETFDPLKVQPVKAVLKVTVCMGLGWLEKFGKKHFDRFSPPDFYVRIGIAGAEADTIMKETKTMEDEWIPKWNEQFEFPLTVPELALLRIEVHEQDLSGKDDFGGQTCLPVSELKTGFRSVLLQDIRGDELGVSLLLRFQWL